MKRFAVTMLCVGMFGSIAFGADLASNATYKAKCAMCHGTSGEGKPAMKTAPMKESASKSDAELTSAIENGKGKMPAFKGKISNDEVKTLVSDIKSLK